MAIHWISENDYEAMSRAGAARIATAIEKRLGQNIPMLLGLATGNTMLKLYEYLAETLNARRLDLGDFHTINLDEYVGADGQWVPERHPLSYHAYMAENFFDRLDPRLGMKSDHIHFPDPTSPDAIDKLVHDMGGLDFQLLGIGFNGHIAFNEPIAESQISTADFAALPTRVIDLTELTIETNARLTADGDRAQVPRQAVTLGMRPILAARQILLLACFAEQTEPLGKMKHGRATSELPASFLLDHPESTIIYTGDKIDLEADD